MTVFNPLSDPVSETKNRSQSEGKTGARTLARTQRENTRVWLSDTLVVGLDDLGRTPESWEIESNRIEQYRTGSSRVESSLGRRDEVQSLNTFAERGEWKKGRKKEREREPRHPIDAN